ncbi:hypothetical protein [Propioniciclava sp.]|uniref:hypothetical protein n=1 Tax=Propioniciclava sp. TaxID=2038686 RepID=UPI00261FE98B|nr:hypothetical protein [Propioniciclava sp.]
MTTVPAPRPASIGWGWALLSVAALSLAIVLAILSPEPIGWFAIGALVLQGLYAAARSFRPTGSSRS